MVLRARDRAAAEGDEDGVFVDADGEDLVGECCEDLERLGVLSVGDDDLVRHVPEALEAGHEAVAVERVHGGVGEDEERRRGRAQRDDLKRGLLHARHNPARDQHLRERETRPRRERPCDNTLKTHTKRRTKRRREREARFGQKRDSLSLSLSLSLS